MHLPPVRLALVIHKSDWSLSHNRLVSARPGTSLLFLRPSIHPSVHVSLSLFPSLLPPWSLDTLQWHFAVESFIPAVVSVGTLTAGQLSYWTETVSQAASHYCSAAAPSCKVCYITTVIDYYITDYTRLRNHIASLYTFKF